MSNQLHYYFSQKKVTNRNLLLLSAIHMKRLSHNSLISLLTFDLIDLISPWSTAAVLLTLGRLSVSVIV